MLEERKARNYIKRTTNLTKVLFFYSTTIFKSIS